MEKSLHQDLTLSNTRKFSVPFLRVLYNTSTKSTIVSLHVENTNQNHKLYNILMTMFMLISFSEQKSNIRQSSSVSENERGETHDIHIKRKLYKSFEINE